MNYSSNPDICVNHKGYLVKLQQFFLDIQSKYDINYWKLDGYASRACTKTGNHIVGGFENMYWFTEMWERWGGILNVLRAEAESRGNNEMWINLTCFVHPSPWLLQWANSIWMQTCGDIGYIDHGIVPKRTVDQLLTYRDSRHFEFSALRQFQFPLGSMYNHDPIYGKSEEGLPGSMDADEFRCYVFMIISRGTMLQNLYYSYNMIDEGEGEKWMITADVLQWKTDNFHILRYSKMVGGDPAQADVYGYSSWDGFQGIISLRNPSSKVQTFSITLDRVIGVKEGAKDLWRSSVLNFRTPDVEDNSQPFQYGQKITKTFQPGEAIIWQFDPIKDNAGPVLEDIKCLDNSTLLLQFNERVNIKDTRFTIDNVQS